MESKCSGSSPPFSPPSRKLVRRETVDLVVFTRPSTIPFLLGIRTGLSSQKLSCSPDLRQWGSGGTDSLGPSPWLQIRVSGLCDPIEACESSPETSVIVSEGLSLSLR